MTEALRLEAAGKTYRQGPVEVVALAPTDLSIHAGQFVAVMGPSGSGKTTMLLLLGGLTEPTTGQIYIDGHDLSRMDGRQRAALRRRSMGFVFQELNLLPGLTAIENVTLPLELDGVPFRKARRAALRALERVEMRELADRYRHVRLDRVRRLAEVKLLGIAQLASHRGDHPL